MMMILKNRKSLRLIPVMLIFVLCIGFANLYGDQTTPLTETKRLAALAKVWGLLKYYHPEVAKGTIDWDRELISAIPAVIAAGDFDSFNMEIENLITQAGGIDFKEYNPQTPSVPDNHQAFKWMKDDSLFNTDLIQKLRVVRKKHEYVQNFYVTYPGVGTANFDNENLYPEMTVLDENYRLLTLFRYWNIINYFFPYIDDMDQDWGPVLREFVPRVRQCADQEEFHLVFKELTTRINDTHGICSGDVLIRYFGRYYAPLKLSYIENKTVVTRVLDELLEPAGAIKVGDIILKKGGTPIDTFRQDIKKYVEASNDSALQRNIGTYAVMSTTEQVTFTVLRNGAAIDVTVKGLDGLFYYQAFQAADEREVKWKILPGNIGYVNMGILEIPDVNVVMPQLMNTRAIIFDQRNYPRMTMYYLAKYLVPKPVAFSKMSCPDPLEPGAFNMYGPYPSTYTENPDTFQGKVVILVNETTQSQAEFTTMILQTAPDATVIGSQTAGADGNVVKLYLPGSIRTFFSGLGVYYPNGKPTQRIGIVPDIYSRPTIAGIQAGRDEVLEEAVQFIENK